MATPGAFAADPVLVWTFYSERRRAAADKLPNPAHRALARLEEALGDRLFLCTQNVDDLHEAAGSRRVHHMHGRLFQSRCASAACDAPPFDDRWTLGEGEALRRCPACGALLRPHICWFGEVPFGMDAILGALDACDVLLVAGTSGLVHPAAAFVAAARARGAGTIYVGPEEPANAAWFDDLRLAPAGVALPALAAEWLGESSGTDAAP